MNNDAVRGGGGGQLKSMMNNDAVRGGGGGSTKIGDGRCR